MGDLSEGKQGPILSWKGLVFRFQSLEFQFMVSCSDFKASINRCMAWFVSRISRATNKPVLGCKEASARRNMFMYGVVRYSEKGEVYLQQEKKSRIPKQDAKHMHIVISGPCWA